LALAGESERKRGGGIGDTFKVTRRELTKVNILFICVNSTNDDVVLKENRNRCQTMLQVETYIPFTSFDNIINIEMKNSKNIHRRETRIYYFDYR